MLVKVINCIFNNSVEIIFTLMRFSACSSICFSCIYLLLSKIEIEILVTLRRGFLWFQIMCHKNKLAA